MKNPDPVIILIELTLLLRRICENETLELSPDTSLADIPGLDSLRVLQSVAHLEEHFQVEIDVAALDDLHRSMGHRRRDFNRAGRWTSNTNRVQVELA